ncbi:hypothetical protein GCM10010172_87210 [Paractinoplanes ferrugineus]|uniref:Uncharacterized protein n=1 Tax=Paractinoplanes ferrugineus TaxID=113564 RepID=A0A919MD84_9ACTN|nr:hypothetical protein Afe05nite_73510 [Actinoplanes ferrugineus]
MRVGQKITGLGVTEPAGQPSVGHSEHRHLMPAAPSRRPEREHRAAVGDPVQTKYRNILQVIRTPAGRVDPGKHPRRPGQMRKGQLELAARRTTGPGHDMGASDHDVRSGQESCPAGRTILAQHDDHPGGPIMVLISREGTLCDGHCVGSADSPPTAPRDQDSTTFR